MKKIINSDSINYTATVIELPVVRDVPGLDKLGVVTVFGNDVLISKDSPEGLYLYFNAGTELSPDFLHQNNLYRDSTKNADPEKAGYFKKPYVEALKLRGVISTGFIIPISALDYLHLPDELEVGDEFNILEFAGERHVIAQKYVPTKQSQTSRTKSENPTSLSEHIVEGQFRLHIGTDNLAKNLHVLQDDSDITITKKVHGSSMILAHVLLKKKLSLRERIYKFLGLPVETHEYGYVWSSGKPRSGKPKGLESPTNSWVAPVPGYYTDNIWYRAYQDYKHKVERGITLYGELIGYTESGTFIQKGYDYGCQPGEYKFQVYRITYTTPQGRVYEFSWDMVKLYCQEHRLDHVKELYSGPIAPFKSGYEDNWRETFVSELAPAIMDKDCINKVPAEGVCVRLNDKPLSIWKVKSKLFILHENSTIDHISETTSDEHQ